uniref:Transmembrane protein 134 n=1 Tax=Plectus sambesii TaxID=2011161 RepID=A0A914VBX8_9BILA
MIKTNFPGHQRNTSAGQQLIVESDEDEIVIQSYGAASPSHPMPSFQEIQRHTLPRTSETSSELAFSRAEQITSNYLNNTHKKFCENPKLRENAKVVIASILLTIVGAILLIAGTVIMAVPDRTDLHGWVFLFAGFLFFTPGIYHVVYILCTLYGRPGYSFDHLPTFSK